jgi:hypothetical protein
MTITAGYAEKIWLILADRVSSNCSTTTTSSSPEPGHAS